MQALQIRHVSPAPTVVGYQGLELRSGYKALGSSFLPVTGDTIDLTEVTVISEDETEEDVNIQVLDAGGGAEDGSMFYWNNFEDGPDSKHGWYDGSSKKAVKGQVPYAIGDALWVYAPDNTFKLQYSGAVDQEGSSVTLRAGYKLVSNPSPVSVNLALVKVAYDDETEEDVNIQKLDAGGGAEDGSMFYWNDFEDGPDSKHGWYNGSGILLEESDNYMIQPGEALWIYSPSDEFAIEFPGVKVN